MPQREIADQFASNIVNGKFNEAYEMLSDSAKLEWNPDLLKEEFAAMYDDVVSAKPRVVTGWDHDSGTATLERGTLLYVPIESSDPWTEAISVVVTTGKISEVEFGRP